MTPPFREADRVLLAALNEYRSSVLAMRTDGWARPMDLGARSGDGTSQALKRLVRLGLVERRQRSDCHTFMRSRASYEYKITAAGLAKIGNDA